MTRFRAVCAAAAALVLTPLVQAGPADALPTLCVDLEIVAHRGYHGEGYDENTVRGFDEAAARGYSIETDAWTDADGQIWIFHDRNVNRATGGTGYIDEMHTSEVAALRYRKAGSPIPTLQQAIASWRQHPLTRVYLEPKQTRIVPAIVSELRAAGLMSTTWFTAQTTVVHRNYPDAKIAPRSLGSNPGAAYWQGMGASAVLFDRDQLTPTDVDDYHWHGIEVQQRTSNSMIEWREAILDGFDAIVTDSPDELKAYCPSALIKVLPGTQ